MAFSAQQTPHQTIILSKQYYINILGSTNRDFKLVRSTPDADWDLKTHRTGTEL